MSEPVSNAEIEDVLSSIRRLVSEDIVPVKHDLSASNTDQTLVLTPAFRVTENRGDASGGDAADENGETAEGDSVDTEAPGSDETPDAAPTSDDDTGEAAVGFRIAAAPEVSETAEEMTEEPAGFAAAPDLHPDDGRDNDLAAGPQAPAPKATELERTIAGLEAAVGLQGGDWEPDGSEIEAEEADEAAPESAPSDQDQDVPAAGPRPDEAFAIPFVHATRTFAEDPAPELRHPAAAADADTDADAAPADAADAAPADAALADAADAGTDIEAEADIDLEADTAETGTDIEPEAAADMDSAPVDDATLIDEETLREMVSEIVYRELQGALGERITRNVRKLVRREIHRVLVSHDFE